jgi:pimeloyl-[acyl-carrier protein] synthase
MTLPTDESETVALERALMDGLFTESGRADPASVAQTFAIPGCRYRFVDEVLHGPRFVGPAMPPSSDLLFQTLSRFMARLPPERHRPVRSRFSGLFTPRRVERYRERIIERVDALIRVLRPAASVDLVSAFTRPLPFSVIADVLGVPEDSQPWLSAAMETLGRAVAGQRDHANVEMGNAAVADMLDYFDQALRMRQQQPRDDLLTLLASESACGVHRDDVLANCIFFILAGHATTSSLLSAGVHLLAAHPEQLDHLGRRPEMWPSAVEELLRYVSPTTLTGATAAVDAQADGCPVAAGAQRTLVFAAANRDPAVFDAPNTFDVTRAPNPHLAFSAGAHFCLGAPLARMHAEVALPALFTRLPGLRLAGPPVWLGSVPVRQIGALPVTWD